MKGKERREGKNPQTKSLAMALCIIIITLMERSNLATAFGVTIPDVIDKFRKERRPGSARTVTLEYLLGTPSGNLFRSEFK